MADTAPRDQNNVPSLLGVSTDDGSSTVKIYTNPTTHGLIVDTSASTITIADQDGQEADVTKVNELRVAPSVRIAGAAFGAAVDERFWTVTNSGAGSASGVANGLATLTSGTANSGYGQIIGTNTARFITGVPNQYRGVHRLTATTVSNNTSGTSVSLYDNVAGSGTSLGVITTTSALIGSHSSIPYGVVAAAISPAIAATFIPRVIIIN